MSFLFGFFFWDTYNLNDGAFDIVPEVTVVFLISFNSFSSSCFIYFHILHSTSPILFSASVMLQLVPSRVFLILVIALYIIDWLLLISSRSLLSISCIFSICITSLFICKPILFLDFGSSLLSLFWIIFQNYFHFFLLLLVVVVFWTDRFLSYFFTCCIFLCVSFCLDCCVWGPLSTGWGGHGSSFLWSLLPVGGIGPVACQVFLVGGVDLDLFSLECNEAYNNEFEVSLSVVWLWSAHLLMFSVVFLFCWRINVGAFHWNLLDLGPSSLDSVQVWRLLGWLLPIFVPCGEEFYDCLTFWNWVSCLRVSVRSYINLKISPSTQNRNQRP